MTGGQITGQAVQSTHASGETARRPLPLAFHADRAATAGSVQDVRVATVGLKELSVGEGHNVD